MFKRVTCWRCLPNGGPRGLLPKTPHSYRPPPNNPLPSVNLGPVLPKVPFAPVCVECFILRSPSRVPELLQRAPKWRLTRTPTRSPASRIRRCPGGLPTEYCIAYLPTKFSTSGVTVYFVDVPSW